MPARNSSILDEASHLTPAVSGHIIIVNIRGELMRLATTLNKPLNS